MDSKSVYFDADLGFPAASVGEIIEVCIHHDFIGYSNEDFRIRSFCSHVCLVDELDHCVPPSATWEFSPPLRETIKIKVLENFGDSMPLYFEIQNIVNGEIYKTSERVLWKKGGYASYVEHLNDQVLAKPLVVNEAVQTSSSVSSLSPKLCLFALFLVIVCLVLGLFVSKMIKFRNESC